MSAVRRSGFVLLAVLWVMVGVSAAGLGIALVARRAARAARNRREERIASWSAEDCLERARAAIGTAIGGDGSGTGAATWATLDDALASATPLAPRLACRIALVPAGRTLDVNSADQQSLARLFGALGLDPARADSVAEAILDWRDPDDVPRPYGAEERWYVGQGRAPPRNGPIADVRELARIRGLDAIAGLDTVLGVEPGRVVLDRAPLPVLAALPGLGPEALARIADLRARGLPVGDLAAFAAALPPSARAELLARYPELVRLTTRAPDAWILTSRATLGSPAVTAAIEVRLVLAGHRAAIVRRRTWSE